MKKMWLFQHKNMPMLVIKADSKEEAIISMRVGMRDHIYQSIINHSSFKVIEIVSLEALNYYTPDEFVISTDTDF